MGRKVVRLEDGLMSAKVGGWMDGWIGGWVCK